MYRVLVVANETAEARELQDEVVRISSEHGGEIALHVLCPALPRPHSLTENWTQEDAIPNAERRMNETLAALRAAGFAADGHVGDSDPLPAIADALRLWPADMILISTHPEKRSKWLRKGVVDRARRFGLPVRHVVSHVAEGVPA